MAKMDSACPNPLEKAICTFWLRFAYYSL